MRRCNCRCNSQNRTCNSTSNTCRCRRHNQNISNITTCNSCMNSNSRNNAFPENYLYGYAYTPNHCMNETFCPEVGLQNGTIFPELVSPYSPGQSIDFIEYLRNGGM